MAPRLLRAPWVPHIQGTGDVVRAMGKKQPAKTSAARDSRPAQAKPPLPKSLRAQLAEVADPLLFLEGLFTHSPVPYSVFTADGRCLLTNPAYRAMFGREPPPDYNVLQDEIAESQGLTGLIRRAFAGETVTTPTIWYDPKELTHINVSDANRVAISCTFFPLASPGGRVGHVAIAYKDVTGELLAQERAEHERDLLRALIEQSGDGIIVSDAAGVVRIFNPAAERQHGVVRQEVSAPDWSAAYGLLDLEGRPLPLAETPLYRAVNGEQVTNARWQVRRPDGEVRTLEGTAAPLRTSAHAPAGGVLVARDVTEQRRMEDEQRRMAAELHDAVRARDEFLSIASHELKSPLTSLSLRLQVLERQIAEAPDSPLASSARRYVETGRKQLKRLSALVGDLLDVSRIQAGRLKLEREPIDLGPLVQEVVHRHAPEAERAGSRLVPPQDAEVVGMWDRMRIEQVVTNLVDNAIKYGAGKPIMIQIEKKHRRAILTVRDQGIGIEPQNLERIFERFERAVSGRHYGGLGLGLYITRQVVEAHGGSLRVESAVGEGSTFTVELPLEPDRALPDPGR